MLGEEAYKTLCLNVYSRLMDEDARAAFLDYIGYEATDAEGNPVAPTEAQMAEAADEYIAHMAERIDTASQTWWEKFVDLVRKALAKRGLLSRADHNALASLLRQSYADLHKAANAEEASQSMAEGGKGETGSKANDVRGDSYEGDFFSDERSVRDIPQLDPGLKKGKEYSIDKVKEIYDRYSSDTEQQALAERVFKVAGTLGIKVDFLREDLGFGIGGKVDGDRMHIARITTLETNKGRTADILLHETIHSVTVTAIDAYRNGDLKNPKLIEAVEEILDVYENVKNDKTLQGEYGLKNAKEMIAEIANPGFRNKLKKLDLWDRLKAAVRKIFFFNESATAEEVLTDALDKILDNFDYGLYEEYARTRDDAGKWDFFNENDAQIKDRTMFSKTSIQIENLFDQAVTGDLTGKPVSIGKLTKAGKEYYGKL